MHAEPGKWFPCLFLTLAALSVAALPYILSFAETRAVASPVHKVSLLREEFALPPPPPPQASEPEPEPEPEPERKKPAKREESVAEVALKEIQASIVAEKKKREDDARERKKREEEEKKRKEKEAKKKREDEKKKKEEEQGFYSTLSESAF